MICNPRRIFLGDQVKGNEMSGHVFTLVVREMATGFYGEI